MKSPAGINAVRGAALHKAIEEDNKYFLESGGNRRSLEDLKNIAEEKFQEKLNKDGVFIPKRDIDKEEKIIQKAQEETIKAVDLYFKWEKDFTPVGIEEYYNLDCGYPLNLVGYMDLIDEENTIWDWKTSSRKTTQITSLQNYIYAKLYETKWGIKPRFKYCSFILTKEPYIYIQEILPPDNYNLLDLFVKDYMNALEKDVFLPSAKYNFLCSEATCPFYLACEYVGGGNNS